MRTAIAVALYYVGLLLGGLILALLIRRLDDRGRSTRNRRRTHRSVAAPAAPSVEARDARVGRPERSPDFPEQWTTTESLAQLLTYSGRLLLAAERERLDPAERRAQYDSDGREIV